MVDGVKEVDGQDVEEASGPLLSQSDIDKHDHTTSVRDENKEADVDEDDGTHFYTTTAEAEDEAEEQEELDAYNGYDNDDNDDDWYEAVDSDRHNWYGCHSDYSNMDQSGSRLNYLYNNASPTDKANYDAAKQNQLNAANAPRTTDNFLALKRAELQTNIAGAQIVVDAGGPGATAAAERLKGLKGAERSIGRLQAKTPEEQVAILKEKFPRQYDDYMAGKPLPDNAYRTNASFVSKHPDLPGGTTPQPLDQRLYQLFALAVTPPQPTVAPAPSVTPTTPTVQVQGLNT